MADVFKDKSFDEILREVGPDATATFDNSPGKEHASSEATNAATEVEGDDEQDLEDEDDLEENEDLEDEDGLENDQVADLEEDDEEDEEEDVETESGV
jgi:hypothetical protein